MFKRSIYNQKMNINQKNQLYLQYNQKKEVNMLITSTKIRGFKAVTIKNIPTRIATRHYFAYQEAEGREIKIVLTKKSF